MCVATEEFFFCYVVLLLLNWSCSCSWFWSYNFGLGLGLNSLVLLIPSLVIAKRLGGSLFVDTVYMARR